jgi:hypothetical protein
LETFDYILPLSKNIDISLPINIENFIIIKGSLTNDGAWEAELPPVPPGVISFQLVFLKESTN